MVAVMGLSPASSFHGDDVPLVYEQTVEGAAGFGIRVDQPGTGDVKIDLETTGPATSSQISIAAGFFDAERNLVFMFALTSHTSPDRLVVSPAPLVNVQYGDGHNAQTIHEEGIHYSFTTGGHGDGCAFACVGLSVDDAGPGPHYFLVWAGGGSTSSLGVRSAVDGATATVNQGPAYVIGDPEITNGAANVQAQETVLDTRAGAKVIVDASYDIEADSSVYGFWGASDFKLACQFTLGACVWGSQLVYECSNASGADCNTTEISYDGPDGGDSGRSTYGILGGAPGSYSFNVDFKADAYTSPIYDPSTGTFVFVGEAFSFLTVTSVDLPA